MVVPINKLLPKKTKELNLLKSVTFILLSLQLRKLFLSYMAVKLSLIFLYKLTYTFLLGIKLKLFIYYLDIELLELYFYSAKNLLSITQGMNHFKIILER